MPNYQIKTLFYVVVLSILLVNCTSKRKLVYFQGSLPNSETNKNYTPTFKPDDLLSITVMGLDEVSVKPFNLAITNLNQGIGGYTQGSPTPPGYLIDADGNIQFPVIGKVKLGGLTRNAAIDTLVGKLKPYLNNPTIIIRILNYKVTVLGEVKNPGSFTIPNERISLPEAIGIAGDLLITGVRKNVVVIREIDGKKTETRVDLTSKDIFSSPVFYLQQNDIVYVEPNRAKINSSVVNPANVSLIISIISIFVTISVLITKN